MDLRRLLMVALSLSMIRVTLPGSDRVCARHDSGHSRAVAGHDARDHSTGLPAPGHHDKGPCETPSRADCCQAVTSCGFSIVLSEEHPVLESPYSDEFQAPS